MRTVGEFAEARSSESKNNFLILRLVAASLVIYGHSFALSTACSSCRDFVTQHFGYRYSGDVGLHIFFVISGFLVVGSFQKRDNLGQFVASRLLRIFPAYIICLLFLVAIGATLSSLPISEFLHSPDTLNFFKSNASLNEPVYSLPGVALTTNPKYGVVMNGSIWTLFIEFRLYVLVALLGSLGVLRNQIVANIVMALLLIVGIFEPAYLPFISENPENWRIAAFFLAGAFLCINQSLIPLNGGALLCLFVSCLLTKDTLDFEIAAGLFIAYGTLFVAYIRKVHLPLIEDYSYGIYIYGWPVSQLILHHWPTLGPLRLAFATLCGAWVAGFLSWHLIEKRALRLKGRFSRLRRAVDATPALQAPALAQPEAVLSRASV
jgi:peptidoglycan/LPS O-acetylase OafA/YrhL